MSNGSVSAKQPKLRGAPPVLTQDETLNRLNTLQDWTEEPARKAAAAVSEGQGRAEVHPAENKQPQKPAKASPDYPWVGEEGGLRPVNFRLPSDLYLKLKWLGDTTYDSSMSKIVIEALEVKVNKMLKERGIKS